MTYNETDILGRRDTGTAAARRGRPAVTRRTGLTRRELSSTSGMARGTTIRRSLKPSLHTFHSSISRCEEASLATWQLSRAKWYEGPFGRRGTTLLQECLLLGTDWRVGHGAERQCCRVLPPPREAPREYSRQDNLWRHERTSYSFRGVLLVLATRLIVPTCLTCRLMGI